MIGHTINHYIRAYKQAQFYIVQPAKKSHEILLDFRVMEWKTWSLLELLFAIAYPDILVFYIPLMDFLKTPYSAFAAIIVAYSIEIMIEWSK